MVNVDIEQLKLKFPVLDVKPFGDCIIVPGSEFDPDWEAELADQGHKCFNEILDDQPATLVRLKHEVDLEDLEGPEEKIVYAPPKETEKPKESNPVKEKAKERWGGWKYLWATQEDNLLISLWNQSPRYPASKIVELLQTQFPKRTTKAVAGRITALQKLGRIDSRHKHKLSETSRDFQRLPKKKPEQSTKAIKPSTKSKHETKPETVDSDSDLNRKITALSQAIENLSKNNIELKAELNALQTKLSEEIDNATSNLLDEIKLRKDLAKHRHLGSGEVFVPLEAF